MVDIGSLDLHKELNDRNYICDKTFAHCVQAACTARPTAGAFLFGTAGTGKSFLPEVIAAVTGAEHFFYQCYTGTMMDDLVAKIIPDEAVPSGFRMYEGVMTRAVKASRDKKVVLTIDEWDKTKPSADAYLLDFLQSGRITFKGELVEADLSNITIFLTMNNERYISEPLMRRMPMIDFEPLPWDVVQQALEKSHPASEYLPFATALYIKSLVADHPKKATVQELRQLLDAMEDFGDSLDVDSLVYQFVTKSKECHAALSDAERLTAAELNKRYSQMNGGRDRLSMKIPTTAQFAKKRKRRVTVKSAVQKELDRTRGAVEHTKSNGYAKYSDDLYDVLVGVYSQEAGDSAEVLGTDIEFEVKGDEIEVISQINIVEHKKLEHLWGVEGEIVLYAPMCQFDDVMRLRKKGLKINYFSKAELQGKYGGVVVGWKLGEGAKVWCSLQCREDFTALFSATEEIDPDGWLNAFKPLSSFSEYAQQSPHWYGIMYHRHLDSSLPSQKTPAAGWDISAYSYSTLTDVDLANYGL